MVYNDGRDSVVVMLALMFTAITVTGVIFEVIADFVILAIFSAIPAIGFAYTLKSYLKTKFPVKK